ncbi:tetrathionate reductase subunit A [Histophilus somni]|uniref:tetrathionate reductase subunit A n=1 Tax=Histophilus somni TaxID=731 RepID=UPI00003971C8|nr:tetrathionate reductase subunit A [Histophilus somni]ACA31113.1 molybdopterin oxidoreductase [Histophilus somni 2336]QQF86998.1 tetrathionate reductase subunit TtrA [Histophilus somni]QQJ89211.1 tetrathionate reductase subunit TtrA [Histophilus somni]
MNKQRRNLIKGALATTAATAFVAGYSPKVKEIAKGVIEGSSGQKTQDNINGNSLLPEYQVKEGNLLTNSQQVVCNTQCMGCWTLCGLRVRIDLEKNKVLRINGNPYHPLSSDHYLDYNQSIKQAELSVSGENGLQQRSTACVRGAAFLDGINSPYRITQPLKRVGKRGEGKWKTISFEQLIDEVVNGGDLFGEGHVDGLKAIRDLQTPVNAQHPDFGAKVNQLMVTFAGPEGRQPLLKRFANNSFGTINFASHGSFCGLSYRAGSGAFMNDFANNSHAKPDWDHVEFILFMGTSPAQSGNPFKRQSRQLAKKRTEDNFEYVVIAPRLELTSTAAQDKNRWVPIIPGKDLSLALAMLRWIIENERYNEDYLSIPSEIAMQQANGVSFCNATHLFIADPNHKQYGQAIRNFHIEDLPEPEKLSDSDILVKDRQTGKFIAAKDCQSAVLFVEDRISLKDGSQVLAKSALQLFKESCFSYSIEEYSEQCGVPVDTIIQLAKKFTSHGPRAAVITHGGTMHSNGFYTAWAILLLNAMIGNMNKKGGMSMSGGKFKDFAAGSRYNLANFPNMVKPKGTNLARSKKDYEKSSEFKQKVAQGISPYPAKAAWYPFVGGQMSEMITSALQGYPYSLKAWINHMGNPIYGMTGIHHITQQKLKDPKILPLFISIDAFMNETTALADYIVPDTHNFESWGFSTPWAGVPTKTSTARWPVIASPNEKTSQGDTICMESFVIEIAKMMQLPGFGDNAILDKQNHSYPLNRSEDFFLRAAANIAYDGKQPVQDATQEDLLLTGVQRLMPSLQQVLKPEEIKKVATIYCKGGRFAPHSSAWQEDNMQARWKNCLQIWNENVAKAKHAQTGKNYHGCPTYFEDQFADNSTVESHYPKIQWPFKLISFKSNLMSSITAPLLRLHSIKPNGIVAINQQDATEYGLHHGELVELNTPGGKAVVQLVVMNGVIKGTIAIEHGYGHKQLGATGYTINGKLIEGHAQIGSGVNINDLGLLDSTKEIASPWVDWVCGSAVRQGIPAKLVKLA